MLSKGDISEIRRYIKRLKREGSTTASVPGFGTPKAFAGNSEAEGSAKATGADKVYTIKPSKKKKHFIKLKELNYQEFKQDDSMTEIQKINLKILQVNRALREVSQALDHSLKLKTESSVDNSSYWKKTNEAILKIDRRIGEVRSKARKLANIKELVESSLKNKLLGVLNKAGISVQLSDINTRQTGSDQYEIDVYVNGEPIALDYNKGDITYQDVDKEVYLGNLLQRDEFLIQNILKALK